MLWRALGDVEAGFFIDVGAQHPIKDSVSKIFSEHGWRGIHVEPTPKFSDMLRADRPNETVITAVISGKQGLVIFFDITDTGLSTGRRDIAEAHAAAGHSYREIAVPALSLDDLLALAPSDDIHWLKIDVEGMEREVLESWRTSHRRPWIVIIEANFPGSQTPCHETWEELILAKGYHYVYYDGLNRFYISDQHRALDDHFTLPPNIFDGFQFDPLSDHAIVIQRLHQAEIAARERDGAIAAAADKAGLEQQIAALRTASEGDRAIASARAALLETCLAEARIKLQASKERLAATLLQLRETQRALDRAREAAAVQERAIRDEMHAQALAHHAAILEQAEAFRGEIARITSAGLEQERTAQFQIVELKRREQEKLAAVHAEKEAVAMQLSHSEDRIRAVLKSRSWTLATPLRWLLREQMIDQPLPEPAMALNYHAVSLPLGHAAAPEVLTTALPRAQSLVDLLSLPAPDFVHKSFQVLLGRAPSAFEQRTRKRSLYLGCGRIAMIAEIHQSIEATSHRSKQREQGNDTVFIEGLYQNYFGRRADPEGLGHYLDLIQRKSRAAVEADVAASAEAVDHWSLPYELERLVKIHQHSGQWWRWFGRRRWENQIRNIESEANAVRIVRHGAQVHGQSSK